MPTVIGLLPKGTKLLLVTASGPDSSTTIDAGSTASLELRISSSEASKILNVLGIVSISGLPSAEILLSSFSADASGVTLNVKNTGDASVTVDANSVSATLLVEAL